MEVAEIGGEEVPGGLEETGLGGKVPSKRCLALFDIAVECGEQQEGDLDQQPAE